VAIHSFFRHVHRIAVTFHKSSTGSSTETASESLLPGSVQRRRQRCPRHGRHARCRLAAGHRIPQAVGPGRPLARCCRRAWRPSARISDLLRRGNFAGAAPAGRMTKAAHEHHYSRRARPGAALTARSSTAPGPALQPLSVRNSPVDGDLCPVSDHPDPALRAQLHAGQLVDHGLDRPPSLTKASPLVVSTPISGPWMASLASSYFASAVRVATDGLADVAGAGVLP
jgi:hypothetical protein